jgi:hypothetical protein
VQLLGVRRFALALFAILGLSFLSPTIVLAFEFWDANWFGFATQTAGIFVFLPTFGIVALAAGYTPFCALVDMYWRHVRFGRLCLVVGLVALGALSYWIGSALHARAPLTYEIAPETLRRDTGEPAGCATGLTGCDRLPVLNIVGNVQQVSRSRIGLREFVHECLADPFVDAQLESDKKRFCFASTPLPPSANTSARLSSSAECCRSQEHLEKAIAALYAQPSERSWTEKAYQLVLPFEVFFLVTAFIMAFALALQHRDIETHYKEMIERIEVGLVIAVVALLFFPLITHADMLTNDAVYGTTRRGVIKPFVPYLSFAYGVGALLVVLFFYRRRDKEVEMFGKMAGVLASAVAVIKYDQMISIFTRVLGSGASWITIGTLAVMSGLIVMALLFTNARAAKITGGPLVED